MNLLLTIEERDIDPKAVVGDRESHRHREAARAVVLDDEGRVALIYAKNHGYYKLPGGGIEQGEDMHIALEREIMEESGCEADVTDEIGKVVEWRDYVSLLQTSYAFLARLKREHGTTDHQADEKEAGFEPMWADDLDAAIDLVGNPSPTGGRNEIEIEFMTRRDTAILKAAKKMLSSRQA